MMEPAPSQNVRAYSAEPTTRPSPMVRPRHRFFRAATRIVGLALVALWVGWWVWSLSQNRLAFGEWSWSPILPFLAGDFVVHIDHTARIFAAGGNPYRAHDWVCAMFPYPPMIPRLFSWVSLLSTRTAAIVWVGTLAAIFAGATWAVGRTRRALGLAMVPTVWLLVAILYSTPVIIAMERGQCDPLTIPMLSLAAWLLRKRSRWADRGAGIVLGLTAWIKYYPGFAIVALLALRRWRALVLFVTVAGGIGLMDRDGVRQSIANGAAIAAASGPEADLHPLKHTVARFWPALCNAAGWVRLARLPSLLVCGLLLAPPVLLVGHRLDRLRRLGHDPGPLLWPVMLWLTTAATFALPYANDYSLVFLPLAALAVWGHRDPVIVPMIFGLLLLWWQPLALPIDGRVLFVPKLLALYAVSFCLILRADERASSIDPSPNHPHFSRLQ